MDQSLNKSEFRLTCAGNEGGGEVRLLDKNGAIQKAELDFAYPGEGGEDKYRFYYDQGKLVFTLYEKQGLSFAGTEQWLKTVQFRYYYHSGSSILCTQKTAKVRLDAHGGAPKGSLESLLNEAPNAPDDCSRAGKARELASLALLGPKARDGLSKLFCPG